LYIYRARGGFLVLDTISSCPFTLGLHRKNSTKEDIPFSCTAARLPATLHELMNQSVVQREGTISKPGEPAGDSNGSIGAVNIDSVVDILEWELPAVINDWL
jgi:hypothetical protein